MIRSLLCGLALSFLAWAQQAPNGGGVAAPNTPPISRTTTEQPIETGNANLSHRVAYISGRVTLEDGTAPPESVTIERICGPIHRLEAHTDVKGHFSFQVGKNVQDIEQVMDASADYGRLPGTLASAGPNSTGSGGKMFNDGSNLQRCELHAVLAGYQSKTVNLSMYAGNETPDVGVLILKRLGGRDGDTISVTNALAPKDAKKAFDKARQLAAKGKPDEARTELATAVELYPKYAAAWLELGRLQLAAGELAVAKQSVQKSLDADPKYLPAYELLCSFDAVERNWPDLASTTGRLIELDPYDYPQAYYFNALAHLNLKHPEEAEKSAREALKRDPQRLSRAVYVLGLALAQRGELAEATEDLKAYLATNPPDREAAQVRSQLAAIDKQASVRK